MSGCGAVDEGQGQQQPATCDSTSSCGGNCTGNTCTNGRSDGCQQQQQQQGSFGSWMRRQATKDNAAQAAQRLQQQQQLTGSLGNCMKCKSRPAVLHIRQQEPYCNECLETGVLQKFRSSTKAQGLISSGDSVMLALSGGAASLSLLHCTLTMKSSSTSRLERGKVPFHLMVLHVDSSAARGVPAEQAQAQLKQLQDAAAAAGLNGQLLVLQLQVVFAQQQHLHQLLQLQLRAKESHQQQVWQELQQQQLKATLTAATEAAAVGSSTQQQQPVAGGTNNKSTANDTSTTAHGACMHDEPSQQQQQQLQHLQQGWLQQLLQLLGSVADPTGREDLVSYLQDSLLLRAAAAIGCSRLLTGGCACRAAAHIIAEAAKGRGFSLPADIQALDARSLSHGGPVLLRPLREVTYKELVALCAFKGLPWSDRMMGQPTGWQRLPAAAAAAATNTSSSSSSSNKAGGHGAASSINSLAERFIADMSGSVPASIYTILRTASHLKPFGFTDVAAVPGAAVVQSSAIKQQSVQNRQQQVCSSISSADCQQQWQLCTVCRAPLPALAPDSTADTAAMNRLVLAGLTGTHCKQLCYSCNRQILYKVQPDAVSGGQTELQARVEWLRQLLPPGMLLEDD